jgi:hypothetical protein
MPGTSAGLNHSLDIHACGRSRMPRACSSSFRVLRQSSSQVSSTVTLKLLRRCLSNSSSDNFSQGYFRRGIGIQTSQKTVPGWCHRIPPATTAESSRRAIVQRPRWLWVKKGSASASAARLPFPRQQTSAGYPPRAALRQKRPFRQDATPSLFATTRDTCFVTSGSIGLPNRGRFVEYRFR